MFQSWLLSSKGWRGWKYSVEPLFWIRFHFTFDRFQISGLFWSYLFSSISFFVSSKDFCRSILCALVVYKVFLICFLFFTSIPLSLINISCSFTVFCSLTEMSLILQKQTLSTLFNYVSLGCSQKKFKEEGKITLAFRKALNYKECSLRTVTTHSLRHSQIVSLVRPITVLTSSKCSRKEELKWSPHFPFSAHARTRVRNDFFFCTLTINQPAKA